jgi:hypothetical protein
MLQRGLLPQLRCPPEKHAQRRSQENLDAYQGLVVSKYKNRAKQRVFLTHLAPQQKIPRPVRLRHLPNAVRTDTGRRA